METNNETNTETGNATVERKSQPRLESGIATLPTQHTFISAEMLKEIEAKKQAIRDENRARIGAENLAIIKQVLDNNMPKLAFGMARRVVYSAYLGDFAKVIIVPGAKLVVECAKDSCTIRTRFCPENAGSVPVVLVGDALNPSRILEDLDNTVDRVRAHGTVATKVEPAIG